MQSSKRRFISWDYPFKQAIPIESACWYKDKHSKNAIKFYSLVNDTLFYYSVLDLKFNPLSHGILAKSYNTTCGHKCWRFGNTTVAKPSAKAFFS
jgi:hypothetical protein